MSIFEDTNPRALKDCSLKFTRGQWFYPIFNVTLFGSRARRKINRFHSEQLSCRQPLACARYQTCLRRT